MAPDQPSDTGSSYRIELIRKAIHLTSLSIPVIYYFVSRTTALVVLIPIAVGFLSIDVARLYHPAIEEWFHTTFGWLLRRHEADKQKKRLNGATYILIAAAICVALFPKFIVIASFSILIISDATAALVGKRFGKRRFLGKTLEGSLAFLASALVVIAATPKLGYQPGEYLIQAAAAMVGTIVEALPIEIDDNLSIPLSIGLVMWVGYAVAYPMMDVFGF